MSAPTIEKLSGGEAETNHDFQIVLILLEIKSDFFCEVSLRRLRVPVLATIFLRVSLEVKIDASWMRLVRPFHLKEFLMNFTSKITLLVLAGSNLMFGSLVAIGPVPSSGSGLGAVNTALTLTSPNNSSTETGCVGAGVGGAEITGSGACPAQFSGGNEQAINNTFSASQLGLVNFSNLQLIFNAAEPGNEAQQGITLDLLALTLWDPTNGDLLGAFYTSAPYVIADSFSGVGTAGYGFSLDAAQALSANQLLAAFPSLYLGVAANASSATGGLETVFFRVVEGGGGGVPPSEVIPEPGTYALVGIGLISAAYWNRRKSS